MEFCSASNDIASDEVDSWEMQSSGVRREGEALIRKLLRRSKVTTAHSGPRLKPTLLFLLSRADL